MSTRGFLLRRLVASLVVLIAVSILCFVLLDIAPGDPALAVLQSRNGGRPVSMADLAAQRARMGLDEPLILRYLQWAGHALTGDFGTSYITGQSVSRELADALPWTLVLMVVATALSIIGAIAVGLIAGLTRSPMLRRGIDLSMFVLGGMPGFVTALLLLYVFAAQLHVLPSGGVGRPGEPVTPASLAAHVILPAAALAFGHHFGAYVRLIETGILATRDSPHVECARARGVARRTVVAVHVLRPALVPFLTRLGVGTGSLLAGAYAIEVVFSWPGMGRAAIAAAQAQNYPLLTAAVLVTAAFVLLANLVGEIAVVRLDPRVRLTGDRAAVAHVY